MAQLNYRIDGTLNGGAVQIPFASAGAAMNWAQAAGVQGAKFMKLQKGLWSEDTEKSAEIAKGVEQTRARFVTSESLKGLSGMVKKGAMSPESLAEAMVKTLKEHGVSLAHIHTALARHYPTVSEMKPAPVADAKPVEQPKTGLLGGLVKPR